MFFLLAGFVPTTMTAQDDLYFVPKKKAAQEKVSPQPRFESSVEEDDSPAYYVGSDRSVDEYNRRGGFRSSFQTVGVDSLGNDVIEFHVGTGEYPDSLSVDSTFVFDSYSYGQDEAAVPYVDGYADDDDYVYTRQMSRWDGFYDPWFYSSYHYNPWWGYGYYPWYTGWYDPWYYGWYDPWYYGWGYPWHGWYGYGYGWYPYGYGWYGYGGGGYYHDYAHGAGTQNHGRPSANPSRGVSSAYGHSYSNGTFGGSRNTAVASRGNAATSRSVNTRGVSRSSAPSSYSTSGGNFGGSRSSASSSGSSTYTPTRSYTPSSSSSGSYSTGGSRSSGGSFGGSSSGGFGGSAGGGGGSRSGGGGGFGGRR